MKFLEKVKKDLQRSGIDMGAAEPPRYWYSFGNYGLNKVMSGSYLKGSPQGRITALAGPSGAGKSFLLCNAMREAQHAGAHIIVLDSENALDDGFVTALGVDVENNYTYISVDTIPQVKKVVSSFITGFKKEYQDDSEAPQIMFAIDSLDMLMTETEVKHFDKGESKGDQGQRNKQLKAMLREFVQAVKRPNISMMVTAQVYRNQDLTNGEGVWIVSDAIRYSLSQVILLTKLKLKEDKGSTKVTTGIRMKCEGFKTRFSQPYQTVTIEVPYETGMDPFNGIEDIAVSLGIVHKGGAWYSYREHKWQGKSAMPNELKPDILIACEAQREKFLEAIMGEDDVIDMGDGKTIKSKRQEKAISRSLNEDSE